MGAVSALTHGALMYRCQPLASVPPHPHFLHFLCPLPGVTLLSSRCYYSLCVREPSARPLPARARAARLTDVGATPAALPAVSAEEQSRKDGFRPSFQNPPYLSLSVCSLLFGGEKAQRWTKRGLQECLFLDVKVSISNSILKLISVN